MKHAFGHERDPEEEALGAAAEEGSRQARLHQTDPTNARPDSACLPLLRSRAWLPALAV